MRGIPGGSAPFSQGCPGTPEQVARLIWFLASDAADHITGTEVTIDGGESLLEGRRGALRRDRLSPASRRQTRDGSACSATGPRPGSIHRSAKPGAATRTRGGAALQVPCTSSVQPPPRRAKTTVAVPHAVLVGP